MPHMTKRDYRRAVEKELGHRLSGRQWKRWVKTVQRTDRKEARDGNE